SFPVIDDEHVDLLQKPKQGVALPLDPEIHCIAGDKPWPLDLLEDTSLQVRVDVGEKQHIRRLMAGRNMRAKSLEDVQLGIQGFRLIELIRIFPSPPKGFSLSALQTAQIDVPLAQKIQVLLREILPNNRNHAHGSEITRGGGKKGCGAP